MRKSKQDLLYEKYPRFFANHNGDPEKTSMCWGISCGEGWYDLIDRAASKIEELYNKLSPKDIPCPCLKSREPLKSEEETKWGRREFNCWRCDGTGNAKITAQAEQVKEKFGTLRIYISSATDEMYQVIAEIEEESQKICEDCGKPGKPSAREGGWWLATLCEAHAGKNRDLKAEMDS